MPRPLSPTLLWPALLGFALSGFFDGILLHQILRWHHLLSAIRTDDLRFQILADGYFHLAMYALAVVALIGLWRARRRVAEAGGRRLAGAMALGFGSWHVTDAVLSHWVLGIHRIKWDADQPLLWDLGWLALFGLVPLGLGLALLRSDPGGRAGSPPRRPDKTVAALALLAGGAGLWAAQPPRGDTLGATTIVFAPNVAPSDALAAALSVGDAFLWTDGQGVVMVSGVTRREALSLYARGALLVSGAGAAPGCFAWAG